jgi:acyl-CoA thioester hydrolase
MKSGYHFCHTLTVRFAETDLQAVVFNANFLMYYDVAWTEYLRSNGLTYAEMIASGFDTLLVRTEVDFVSPARFDDMLDIYVRTSSIRNSSLVVRFEMYNKQTDTLVNSATSTYVCVDGHTHQPVRVPDDLRVRLTRFEQTDLSVDGSIR